jgi:conjugal transfer/entry exclusion protein
MLNGSILRNSMEEEFKNLTQWRKSLYKVYKTLPNDSIFKYDLEKLDEYLTDRQIFISNFTTKEKSTPPSRLEKMIRDLPLIGLNK